MSKVSPQVKSKISMMIKRFKFTELESAVMPIFPELIWSRIKSKLVHNHQSFTTPNALSFILEEIEKKDLSDKILKDRISVLEVADISRHFMRRVWYAYECKGEGLQNFSNLEEMQNTIKERMHDEHHINAEIKAIKYKSVVFVSVKEKPRKRNVEIVPTYFCLLKNDKYYFCQKKSPLQACLSAVNDAMHYRSSKKLKLFGRDIPSLVMMLRNRKEAQEEDRYMAEPQEYDTASPVSTAFGYDFTQLKQRNKYANEIYGEEPPTFEVLTVRNEDQEWVHEEAQEKLPDEKIFLEFQFRSPDIANLLKSLITQKVLSPPIPHYAANILTIARNDILLKQS